MENSGLPQYTEKLKRFPRSFASYSLVMRCFLGFFKTFFYLILRCLWTVFTELNPRIHNNCYLYDVNLKEKCKIVLKMFIWFFFNTSYVSFIRAVTFIRLDVIN